MTDPIRALIHRANVLRWAALLAPTPRQAQAAHRLADQALHAAKQEGTRDD